MIASREGCKRGNGKNGEWTREGGRTRQSVSSNRRETGPVIHPGLHHVCKNRAGAITPNTGGTAELIFSPVPGIFLGTGFFIFTGKGADTMKQKYRPGRRWCGSFPAWGDLLFEKMACCDLVASRLAAQSLIKGFGNHACRRGLPFAHAQSDKSGIMPLDNKRICGF